MFLLIILILWFLQKCRIVHAQKLIQQPFEFGNNSVVFDLNGLGMVTSEIIAINFQWTKICTLFLHVVVRGMFSGPSSVANSCVYNAWEGGEFCIRTPEAAH